MRKQLYPALVGMISEILDEIPAPNDERKDRLSKLVNYLRDYPNARNLNFVCTHNSRRSHLSQYWSAAAAAYYSVKDVHSFSGGTEATAFHLNTIDALVKCEFEIREVEKMGTNPRYQVTIGGLLPKMTGFSKTIDDPSNPQTDFCAVLVCSEADEKCPFVPGATTRILLPFEDPKIADGTPNQSKVYLQRSKEIGRELLWVFEQVADS